MKNTLIVTLSFIGIAGLSSFAAADGIEHSPRLRGALDYEIGGYHLNSPTTIDTVSILDLGAGWDLNMECGEFDPLISVSNQLNGVTDGFRDMMSNIISSATGAVASYPALAIQRANPGLYDMLQQGILQGKMDVEGAETSCEEMSSVLMGEESFPFEKYKLAIKTNAWANEINSSSGDAVRAAKAVDEINHGNEGAEWICETKKGGTGQPPIKTISDVVLVGYNIMFDRPNVCDTSAIASPLGAGSPLWEYWSGPLVAVNWAKQVLGDIDIRTCDGCKKMQGTPGKGLTYRHRDIQESIVEDLFDLEQGDTPMGWQNLRLVSAPPEIIIDDIIITAIQKLPGPEKGAMVRKLGNEVAYARLVTQSRLMTQLLRAGVREPNIAAFEPAKIVVNESIDQLQDDLDLLEHEITTRQLIAKNTIIRILGNEEKRVQNIREPKRGKAAGTNQIGQPN